MEAEVDEKMMVMRTMMKSSPMDSLPIRTLTT
jgi:hypothetical protein